MKFILGKKQSMTQIFDETGRAWPATVIAVPPAVVTRVKSFEPDGYQAIQLGLKKKDKRQLLREFRINEKDLPAKGGSAFGGKVGDQVDVGLFQEGDLVKISGISKAKGFQGVVKRHGFHGGPRTHGQKHSEREPGSIGSGLRTRVPRGTRMAGRMGGQRVSVKNLKVLKVDPSQNFLVVSGAVPGRRGTILEIRGK